MSTSTYWPSRTSVAYKVLTHLASKPLGFELPTSELNKKLDLEMMGLNSFMQHAVRAGYASFRKDTSEVASGKLMWTATQKFRDELQLREPAEEAIEPPKKNGAPCTQYVRVNKHKTPYELERLIRCAHEVRHSPKEFMSAMEELYEAAGIPHAGQQHAK